MFHMTERDALSPVAFAWGWYRYRFRTHLDRLYKGSDHAWSQGSCAAVQHLAGERSDG